MIDMKKIEEMARADGWKPPTIDDIEDKSRTCEKCGTSWEIIGNENGLLPQGYGTCPKCNPDDAAYRVCEKCKKTYISAMQYGAKDRITECPHCTSKTGCFIATACYGTPDCAEVVEFRRFRDETLLKTRFGRLFVVLYYRISPTIAVGIGSSQCLRSLVKRCVLEPTFNILRKK